MHLQLHPHLAQILNDIEGKRIVIIYYQNHKIILRQFSEGELPRQIGTNALRSCFDRLVALIPVCRANFPMLLMML